MSVSQKDALVATQLNTEELRRLGLVGQKFLDLMQEKKNKDNKEVEDQLKKMKEKRENDEQLRHEERVKRRKLDPRPTRTEKDDKDQDQDEKPKKDKIDPELKKAMKELDRALNKRMKEDEKAAKKEDDEREKSRKELHDWLDSTFSPANVADKTVKFMAPGESRIGSSEAVHLGAMQTATSGFASPLFWAQVGAANVAGQIQEAWQALTGVGKGVK